MCIYIYINIFIYSIYNIFIYISYIFDNSLYIWHKIYLFNIFYTYIYIYVYIIWNSRRLSTTLPSNSMKILSISLLFEMIFPFSTSEMLSLDLMWIEIRDVTFFQYFFYYLLVCSFSCFTTCLTVKSSLILLFS